MRAGSWGGHAMRVRLGCGTRNRQPTRGKVKGLGTTPCWIVQGKARQARRAPPVGGREHAAPICGRRAGRHYPTNPTHQGPPPTSGQAQRLPPETARSRPGKAEANLHRPTTATINNCHGQQVEGCSTDENLRLVSLP